MDPDPEPNYPLLALLALAAILAFCALLVGAHPSETLLVALVVGAEVGLVAGISIGAEVGLVIGACTGAATHSFLNWWRHKRPRRVLVLDCGGITNPDSDEFLEPCAEAMGVTLAQAQKGQKEAWAQTRVTKRSASSFWNIVFDVAGVAPERRTAATVAACEEAMAAGLRLSYPETLRVIELLKLRGVAIGMISNHIVSPNWFVHCEQGAGLSTLVSHPSLLIVSQEVGVGKPDRAIYERFSAALEALHPGVRPEQLLFVDDKQKNVDAATKLGWKGLCFDSRKAASGDFARALAACGLPRV